MLIEILFTRTSDTIIKMIETIVALLMIVNNEINRTQNPNHLWYAMFKGKRHAESN